MPRIAAFVVLSIAGLALAGVFAGRAFGAPMILVVTGKLETGIMAVGGETTGTTVTTAKDGVYELDIKDAALQKKADDLSGKTVTVTGTLTIKPGVEIGQRRIISVQTLAPAAPATGP